MKTKTQLIREVFEQVVDDSWCVIDKYCADEITFREGRDRIRMLEHILIRLNYEEQEPEILAMIERFTNTIRGIENKLVTIDLKKHKYLHELQRGF